MKVGYDLHNQAQDAPAFSITFYLNHHNFARAATIIKATRVRCSSKRSKEGARAAVFSQPFKDLIVSIIGSVDA